MRKPSFCICENKDADQLRGNAQLICVFVFATHIVQSLYFLNPKFQASSHLLWLYSPVCVGAGRKPRRPVFSQRGSNISSFMYMYWVYFDNTCFKFTVCFLCLFQFMDSSNSQGIIKYEPRSEKTGLRGFRPGPTQTGLYCHRRWLEA